MLVKAILNNNFEDIFCLLREFKIQLKAKRKDISNKTLILDLNKNDLILSRSFNTHFCELIEIAILSLSVDLSYSDEKLENILQKNLNKKFKHTHTKNLKSQQDVNLYFSKFNTILAIKDKINEKFDINDKSETISSDTFYEIDLLDFIKINFASVLLKINKDFFLNIGEKDRDYFINFLRLDELTDIQQSLCFLKTELLVNNIARQLNINSEIFLHYSKKSAANTNMFENIRNSIELSNIKKTNQEDLKTSNSLSKKVKEIQKDVYNYNSSSEDENRVIIIQASLNTVNVFKLRSFFSGDNSSHPIYHKLKIDGSIKKEAINDSIEKIIYNFNKTNMVEFVLDLESLDKIKDLDAINYLVQKSFIKRYTSINYGYLPIAPDDYTIRVSFWNKKNKLLISTTNDEIIKAKKIMVSIKRYF